VPVEEGGQGLPASLGIYVNEMVGSANWAWSMYPGLAQAPITCLLASGTDEQKESYLPKLLSGEWAGTMCLSEAHAGSDVGLLTSKAVPNGDGSYAISGSKIFISGGDQDLTENIIHTVLARVEGAPAGTKGISLFVVPKRLVREDGSLSDANGVECTSIERKMGIKGSATCVMSFDGAVGTLLGEENGGLEQMFKMMNAARVGTALQGISMGELAFQKSLAYAKERLQMRSFTGVKNPEGEADPIIVHPDIRRMLLVQKSLLEGNRAFLYWLAHQVDKARYCEGDTAKAADDLLGLLTPVAKAFCTETAIEATNLGMQVLGGHGYVSDNGLEQIVRDTRVSAIYEGTTGIQALDLLGRKVLGSGGKLQRSFSEQIRTLCQELAGDPELSAFGEALEARSEEWDALTASVSEKVMHSADEIGAASVDYIMFTGYLTLGYLWARMAKVSRRKLAEGGSERVDEDFYRAKLFTARFYFERILPRTGALAASMASGAENLMELEAEHFAF
jgi:alkylation response protein AidB-like acyl-CoA dehydrogenase